VGVAVRDHQHPPARFGDARQLTDPARHVRNQHHAELRPGHVEAVVVELKRVTVHHPCLHAEPLFPRTPLEPLEHRRREIRRKHPGAEPRRGNAERSATGGHIEEPHPSAESGTAQAIVS
jgi:hypothetical protein